MNDCIWCFIKDCCDGMNCNCDKYISANSEQGDKILEQYSDEVEFYLQPLYEKYRKIFQGM